MRLDEAWAAAEKALPKGGGKTQVIWRICKLTVSDDGHCVAVAARSVIPVWSSTRTDFEYVVGVAKSPAKALERLAEKLREWEPNRHDW